MCSISKCMISCVILICYTTDFLRVFTMHTYDGSQCTPEKKVTIYAQGTCMYMHISLSCIMVQKCTWLHFVLREEIQKCTITHIVVNVAFAGCTLQRKVTSRPGKMEHLYTLLTVCNRKSTPVCGSRMRIRWCVLYSAESLRMISRRIVREPDCWGAVKRGVDCIQFLNHALINTRRKSRLKIAPLSCVEYIYRKIP